MAFSGLNLGTLDGTSGFRLNGASASDQSGNSVASAGDVNGDGYDDLIVGARYADPNGNLSGASYVVFGKASGFAATLALSTLDGTTGFRLDGAATSDRSGWSVASAGDVNGDGYDDLIVGARFADPNGTSNAGSSYVVFGKASGFAATVALSTLDGTTGFRMDGAAVNDFSASSVASAGDVNGDGYDDLIVGAHGADPNGGSSGSSYVVFGKASGFAATLALSTLDGTTGFRLNGAAAADYSGGSVASAGDVNGDGYDDLIVGAWGADPNGTTRAGASYVVFGKASGFAATLGLGTLDGTTGFRLDGAAAEDLSGFSVASAGDVNGDGYADLIVGAQRADPNGADSGATYVVFGKASGFAATLGLGTLDGTTGFRLAGAAGDQSGYSVASAGDVNGDGYDDLIVGAKYADPNGADSGASYVVFGKASGFLASIVPGSLDGTTGLRLSGTAANDWSGFSVASAGDVNGDGYADLIVGAPLADPNGTSSGSSYVVFGRSGLFTTGDADPNTLTGGASDDALYGLGGDDTLDGMGGHDTLNGGAGADTMTGGAGNDTYQVDDAGDAVVEAAAGGVDTVKTTLASYVLGDDVERLEFVGTGDFTGIGNGLDNLLTGGSGNDTLDGGAGSDMLRGAEGMDTMTGGSGNDIYQVDDAGDVIIELGGGGIDTVRTALSTYTLGDHVERVQFRGTGDFTGTGNGLDNVLRGGDGDDTLEDDTGNDTLIGGAGADQMTGGAGDDTYSVDDAGDVVVELAAGGTDTVRTTLASYVLADNVEILQFDGTGAFAGTGNALANTITGGTGNDTLDGGLDRDTLRGGAGNDVLIGGAGADKLVGGAGADMFVFRDTGDSTRASRDTILGFTVGTDVIDLTQIDGGFQALQTVTSAPATIGAHSLVAFVLGNGNTVLYANNTDDALSTKNASMEIVLKGVTTLSDADLDYLMV
jgi:Ca2+-binding RTX toxin-like protein